MSVLEETSFSGAEVRFVQCRCGSGAVALKFSLCGED